MWHYQTCINPTFCAFIIKWCFYCWKLLVILFLLFFLTKGIDMDMASTKRSNIVIYYVFKGLWRLLLTSFPDNTSNEGFIKSLLFWFVLRGWSNVGCNLWGFYGTIIAELLALIVLTTILSLMVLPVIISGNWELTTL